MKTIHKFTVPIMDSFKIMLPKKHKFLNVEKKSNSELFVWFELDPNHPEEEQEFYIFGTGFNLDSVRRNKKHLGSTWDGIYAWHLYERVWFTEA